MFARTYSFLKQKPFILFTLILLIKSYLAWLVIFDEAPSWTPLITELPFVWLLFCLIEWFATKRKIAVYLIVNLLCTSIFFAVIMYYKYYGVIVTYHALQQVNQVTAVSNSVFSLLSPQYLLIFVDILVISYLLFRRRKTVRTVPITYSPKRRVLVTALFTVSLVLCFLNIMPNRASMNEIKKAEEMGILNYEAYTLLSKEKIELIDPAQITQPSINQLKGIQEPSIAQYAQAAAGKNIIIIQLESFQNFLINLKIDGQEITPVMNKLANDNFYFSRFYQQVGQGNTSDAEFIVNTSAYIPPIGAAAQVYATKQLPSLPKLLKKQGYTSATFHTNVVEFWNRSGLYKSLGFDHYYDKSFFGETDTVFFGASDEVLYKKTSAKLQEMAQSGNPFYAQVISMTAHHPFSIPEEKDKITLPKRYQNTFVGDYIRSQSYADYALGLFIEELKTKGLWDNSLIVVYGDHLGLPFYSLNRDDIALMEEIYGREYVTTDMIHIPLIMASTGVTYPAIWDQVGGQVDILPTIANLVGASLKDQLYFGQDLLNQTHNLLPQRYYLPSGSLINDQALFIPGIGFEDGTKHPLERGKETSVSRDDYEKALELLKLSHSYLIQLPEREE